MPDLHNIPAGALIFYAVFLCCLALVGGWLLLEKLRRKPSIEVEFATKHELRELEKDMDARFDKLDSSLDDKFAVIDAKRSRQVAQLHDDIRAVGSKVDRLLGYNDARDGREGR